MSVLNERKDYCVTGTPKLSDDMQTCLAEVQRLASHAIDAAIKAQNAANPVEELLMRQLLKELHAAYGTCVQIKAARKAANS